MPDVSEPAARLGRLIRDARGDVSLTGGARATQEWLGDQCEPRRQPQQISKFESGEAVPADITALAELFHVLRRAGTAADDSAAHDFLPWVGTWLEATRKASNDSVGRLLDEALRLVSAPPAPKLARRGDRPLTSLADFPGDDPLTIIMSDRREQRVTSAAECLIYSGSVTDAMFLPYMWEGLEGAKIRSDKLLVRMPPEYLEEQVPELSERNLLIIGSPAGNWGARILNKGAIFPFRIDSEMVRISEAILDDDRMQDEDFASEFWALAEATDGNGIQLDPDELAKLDPEDRQQREAAAELARRALGPHTTKAVMNQFRSQGLLDPADQENHGTFVHSANDFAVVTIARNPYSKSGRHRAVICAGIHGPGTAAALRELLVNPQTFERRPLGAVLEVRLRTDLAWSERFDRAKVKPQTKEYEASTVLNNIEAALRGDPPSRMPVFRWWDPEALQDAGKLVREIISDARRHGKHGG